MIRIFFKTKKAKKVKAIEVINKAGRILLNNIFLLNINDACGDLYQDDNLYQRL